MPHHSLRFALLLTLWVSMVTVSNGQALVLENKVNISVTYGFVTPLGMHEAAKGNFVSPTLFPNYQSGAAYTLQYAQAIFPRIHLGLSLATADFYAWTHPESHLYDQSTASIRTFSVNFILKNKFHESGIWNKLSYRIGLSPGLYQFSASIPNGMTAAVSGFDYISEPISVSSSGFNISADASLQYAINALYAIRAGASWSGIKTSSVVYPESSMQWIQFNVGLAFQLRPNKRYLQAYE